VPAKGFHDGLTADVPGEAETLAKGIVDELDAAFGVEQEHAFDHAVEEGLQAGLGLDPDRLFALAGGFGEFTRGPFHFGAMTTAQPEVLEAEERGASG
jgi:hypothetical protein